METDTGSLEMRVRAAAEVARAESGEWRKFMARMEQLKIHDERTYRHSLRVGLYAFGIADEEGLDTEGLRLALLGGIGHDIGKIRISKELLNAERTLSRDEFDTVKKHAEYGFEELKDDHPDIAAIAGMHHCFQPEPYGRVCDDTLLRRLASIVEIIRLADFFDSRMTRHDKAEMIWHDPSWLEDESRHMKMHIPNATERMKWLEKKRIS